MLSKYLCKTKIGFEPGNNRFISLIVYSFAFSTSEYYLPVILYKILIEPLSMLNMLTSSGLTLYYFAKTSLI